MSQSFVELGSIAKFINGAAFKPEDWGESGLRIIRIQNLTDLNKPFNRTERIVSDAMKVQHGDLLVSWSATLGVYEWTDSDEALLNQHIFRVLPDEIKVDKRYLRHGLEGAIIDMQQHLHGATMQHVNRGEFLKTKLYLPPIDQQKRIAAILDKAEELRRLRRKSIEHLDVLSRSIFIEMFGDPSKNPKGWDKVDIGSVGSIQGGLQVSASRSSLPYEIPYLRVANVYRDELNLSEIKTIRATEIEVKRTLLQTNDILIVEGHGNANEIGRCALWDGSIKNCIHQNHLIRLRCNLKQVHPVFVSRYMNSEWGRRDLLKAGKTTSGLNTISISNVRAVQLQLPPLSLQQEFAQRIEAIEHLKSQHRESLAQLDKLFASLQHRAFRGEL